MISRKIRVGGKLLNFHTLEYSQSKFPIRLLRSVWGKLQNNFGPCKIAELVTLKIIISWPDNNLVRNRDREGDLSSQKSKSKLLTIWTMTWDVWVYWCQWQWSHSHRGTIRMFLLGFLDKKSNFRNTDITNRTDTITGKYPRYHSTITY